MASPPLAASVPACLHSLKDGRGHAGGELQCTHTLSLRYLRLNRSLEAAGVADAVIEAHEGDRQAKHHHPLHSSMLHVFLLRCTIYSPYLPNQTYGWRAGRGGVVISAPAPHPQKPLLGYRASR